MERTSGRRGGTLSFRFEVTNFPFCTTQTFHGNGGGMRKRVLPQRWFHQRYSTLDSKTSKAQVYLIGLLPYRRDYLSVILPDFLYKYIHSCD